MFLETSNRIAPHIAEFILKVEHSLMLGNKNVMRI